MGPSGLDAPTTTLVSLGLLAFFALLLVGGLVLVGALGVLAYRSYRAKQPESERAGCIAAVLLGALLLFLGVLGVLALGAFVLMSTITSAAGVARTYAESEPAPVEPVPLVREAPRARVVAEVRGPLDGELVQRLSDIAMRRRELDLHVRSLDLEDGETWVYEFVLPPRDVDPQALQLEMRRELEERGLVPVSLTTSATATE